ncbi:MAG: HNH endonuclease signature motif containing protein, partial [Burkholderiales bacterium]
LKAFFALQRVLRTFAHALGTCEHEHEEFEDGQLLHLALEHFLLSLNPLVNSRGYRKGPTTPCPRERRFGQPDLLVETRCEGCQHNHAIHVEAALLKHLRSRKSLKHGAEPPEICRLLVFLRCHGRCESPGCTRAMAHTHHIDERRYSINHHPSNLLGLCAVCHLRLVHAGEVGVRGKAPHALVWTYSDGRVLKSGEYPTPMQLVARVEAEGLGEDAAQESPPLCLGLVQNSGPRGLYERGAIEVVKPQPLPEAGPIANILKSERDNRTASCEYGIFARELSSEARRGKPLAGHASVADLCRIEHGLEPWEVSERKALARAAEFYPFSLDLFRAAEPGATKRKILTLARSGAPPSCDRLAGLLMLHSTEDDYRRVVAALCGPEDDWVEWKIPVSPETEKLWRWAWREIQLVHGRKLQSEEVLAYILDALRLGYWGEVKDRPAPIDTLSGVHSLERRGTPPNYSGMSLFCDKCGVMWFYDADGAPIYHDATRMAELWVGADRISWLPESESSMPKADRPAPPELWQLGCGVAPFYKNPLHGSRLPGLPRLGTYSRAEVEAAVGRSLPFEG